MTTTDFLQVILKRYHVILHTQICIHMTSLNLVKISHHYSTEKLNQLGQDTVHQLRIRFTGFQTNLAIKFFLNLRLLIILEIYPNGLSTSLPLEVQEEFLLQYHGLERCEITQPGYAIEYSYFDPRDLKSSLKQKISKAYFLLGK